MLTSCLRRLLIIQRSSTSSTSSFSPVRRPTSRPLLSLIRHSSPAPAPLHPFCTSAALGICPNMSMYRPQNYDRRRPRNRNNQHHHQQHHQQQPPKRNWETCANTDISAIDPPNATASDTTDNNNSSPPHFDLTVMSYNILAQHLIAVHPELYARHQSRHLDWSHRFHRLLHTIRQAQPTVLCLQELQHHHLPEFAEALRTVAQLDGHVYQKRTAVANHDGCAIFYRTDRVRLVRSHSVEYEQPHGKAAQLLDRPNVAVLAHFEATGPRAKPGMRLVVATTHLLYNPKREDVRLAQVQLLLAELDRCAWLGKCPKGSGKDVFAPVVVTGDLNAAPHSATVELLTRGTVMYAERVGSRLLVEATQNGGGQAGVVGGAFGTQLLPVQLGITDECQHAGVVGTTLTRAMRAAHVADMSATLLHHSQANTLLDEPDAAETRTLSTSGLPFQTGRLRHAFGLRSVYDDATAQASADHKRSARPQRTATTFHDDWLTVDYIMYSRPWCELRRRHAEGAALRLLGRWQLPSVGECQQRLGCIPNAEHGSDHVSLAAAFRLGASEWTDVDGDATENGEK